MGSVQLDKRFCIWSAAREPRRKHDQGQVLPHRGRTRLGYPDRGLDRERMCSPNHANTRLATVRARPPVRQIFHEVEKQDGSRKTARDLASGARGATRPNGSQPEGYIQGVRVHRSAARSAREAHGYVSRAYFPRDCHRHGAAARGPRFYMQRARY